MTARPVPGMVEDRNRPTAGDVEQRAAPTAAPTMDGARLRGLIPYGVESRDLGGWTEVIERGALNGTRMDDLVATVDHGGVPIARHPGTLQMEDTTEGMRWSLQLPESRSDVREAVERGDLCAGSWRMIVARDEWRGNVRHIHDIAELRDVSVVSSPAYSASVVEHRSHPAAPTPPAGPTPGPAQRPAGGLHVEDRGSETPNVRGRIERAIANVPKGEARDLTRVEADPVEPDDLRTVLLDRFRESVVLARAGVPIVATDRGIVTQPMLTADVEPQFYGELEQIEESDPVFDDFSVAVKKIAVLTRLSSESVEDSDPALLGILTDHITQVMALKGDRELVAGNDPKGFKGLLNVTGTSSIAVDGALTWDPILRAVAKLVEAQVPGPYAVLMGPRPALALDLAKETTGGYLAAPGGIPPILQTGWLPVSGGATPTTTAVVFAPAQQQIVVRKEVQVEVDRSQEFDTDAVLVRGRYRLGLGVPRPETVVKLTGIAAPAI